MLNRKYKKYKDNIIKIREDIYVNKDRIDTIVYTNIRPDGESNPSNEYFYIVYLNNSKYNWVMVPKEYFENNIKHYINF